MNLYANLTDIKRSLGITGTTFDAALVVLAESICRAIDDECGRAFYPVTATRYYDGSGSKLWLGDDLLTVTTLKTDDGGDGTYENTLAVTDYWLWPDNSSPKRRIDINPEGDYAGFPSGRRRVQLVGVFGYSNDTEAVGTLGAAIVDTTGTSATMTAGHSVSVGDTIYADSEQMYVSVVATNTLTVIRGVNGTTAATHLINAAVTRQKYASAIVQAVKMQIGRFWNEEKTGYSGSAGNAEVGGFTFSTLYPAIRDMISPYIAPVAG